MKKPSGYWKDERNHRFFFENLAKTLGFSKWTDWYNVSVEVGVSLQNNGVRTLKSMAAHHFLQSISTRQARR